MFTITFVTIFPDIFPGALGFGLSGKSVGVLWDFRTVDIRNFAENKHKKVDDEPYGGGAGMIIKPDVVHRALEYAISLYSSPVVTIFMTPSGKIFSQKLAKDVMKKNADGVVILCGRYEGIDQRVIDFWKKNNNMIEISIGDYVLFGGEIPAMVISDTCIRIIPGMMNNEQSILDESFSDGLLEYPQYTKPRVWMRQSVPEILLSGHHEKIRNWRLSESISKTEIERPEILNNGENS